MIMMLITLKQIVKSVNICWGISGLKETEMKTTADLSHVYDVHQIMISHCL